MTYINPLAGTFASAGQVARTQSEDKDRQLQRAETLRKNSAAKTDRLEHEVESSDAVHLQEDEPEQQKNGRNPKRRPPKDEPEPTDEEPRLDLKA